MATLVEILLQQLLVLTAAVAMASPNNTLSPTCPEMCGNLRIPYPFGIGPNCFLTGFEIVCDHSQTPPKPLLDSYTSNIEVVNISLHLGQFRVYKYIAWVCYNATASSSSGDSYIDMGNLPFWFSDTRNKFTAIGCDTLAYIMSRDEESYASGCVSTCKDLTSVADGSCSGIGCCQTSIPKGLKYYNASFDTRFNHSSVYQFNPCSYAFLGDKEWYNFSRSDIIADNFLKRTERGVPLVLDWAIGDQSCAEAKLQKTTSYACLSEHSDCIDSSHGLGYLCNCSSGYKGNPYLRSGCQDINECEDPEKYPCYGKCQNVEGNYTCSCPPGTRGDPYKGSCQPKFPLLLKLVVGISAGIVLTLAIGFCIFMVHQEKKLAQAKQNFFEQNGGVLLYDKIKKEQGITFRIFKEEELEKATNKFDKNLELGRGGHGAVYEGILDDIGKVAVKKAKVIDKSQKEEFVKEMVILSQINHRNVVKLLGCCLEVEVPILVYEYVPNGTLAHHIHQMNKMHPIPLDSRLRIAIESAEALAYLHSSASPPILHGDVKSTNILLDDNYVAKVSDFGASVLVPKNDAQFAALVQGTRGYLDPEYLQTSQLTEKSDVYSFGIVLLELLTGKEALYFEGSKEAKSLAQTFLFAMKEGRLIEILDSHATREGDMELLQELALLILQCLSVKGEERPTMKEVVEELHRLRKYKQHPWVQHNPEETQSLLGESSSYHASESTAFYSLEKRASMDIEAGR